VPTDIGFNFYFVTLVTFLLLGSTINVTKPVFSSLFLRYVTTVGGWKKTGKRWSD